MFRDTFLIASSFIRLSLPSTKQASVCAFSAFSSSRFLCPCLSLEPARDISPLNLTLSKGFPVPTRKRDAK
ncbi:hypothetical protein Y1Q_0013828 [Alligator mississippiensis]|uniref:Uncharacterized protein n=1 Tax=Alligator mississippiensis TaxID=8496 RepID=A0A151NG36_ALLMI|nr:hypothetical protein Y1Q_0013828 [Alligator mississippiensis]